MNTIISSMNVAIIITSLTGGGAERVAGLLSKAISPFHNVYIFLERADTASYEYGGKLVEFKEAFDGVGCTIESALAVLKKKYDIQVSVSFMESSNIANIRSQNDDVVIISERSTYSQVTPRLREIDKLITQNYNSADKIIACSYGVSQSLHNEYSIDSDKISVIFTFS